MEFPTVFQSAMSEESHDIQQRDPEFGRDVIAIALVGFTLLLTVSVVTRNPADPIETPIWPISRLYQPDQLVYPPAGEITNACGYWGALIAAALFDAVGIGSAFIIAGIGGVATALLMRGRLNAPVLRSLGGTLIVLGVCTAASMLPARFEGMPVVGAGGYMGAMSSEWLHEHFAPAGSWILTLCVLAVGLLLTTDYALLYAGKRIVSGGAELSRRTMERASDTVYPIMRRPKRRPYVEHDQPFGDTERKLTLHEEEEQEAVEGEDEFEDPPPSEPRIKVRKPRNADTPADIARDASPADDEEYEDVDDEELQGDYEDEYEEEEDEPEVEPVVREIEVEGETITVRQDEEHEVPAPKIRLPKRGKNDERQQLYDNMKESAPEGSEDYRLPSIELLEASDDISYDEQLSEVRRKAKILEATFRDFGFNIRVVEIETGPVIAQYEIELEAGLRLSKITSLAEDLAIGLRVPSVRIVAPIPGKNTVGIEVPNETRQVVRLRDVMEESDTRSLKMNIPVFLGKDVSGNPMVVDLAKMPHLLIAGRTGTGKSVCLNAIICSVLMTCRPDEVRMLMIDPKMVELSGYGKLPHLMHPVITDMRKAEAILAWAVEKMEERYSLLANVGVRHITSYNATRTRRTVEVGSRSIPTKTDGSDSRQTAVHRDRRRRDGRLDDDRRKRRRATHHSLGAEKSRRRDSLDPGDAETDRRRHHRIDQKSNLPARIELPSGQQDR